jgi:phosphomannomutase
VTASDNHAQHDPASALMISVSGIRGVVGQALSPGNALDFVQAYAAWLKNKGIEQPEYSWRAIHAPPGK